MREEFELEEEGEEEGGPSAGAAQGGGTLREFGVGAQILRDLGLRRIRLLSNNPRRIAGLEGYGLEIESVISLERDQATTPQPNLDVIVGGLVEQAAHFTQKELN